MNLGTRLKQARQKKKLTQADLAVAIGIKQQAIQRIEAGKVKSTSYIVQMAKVLNVSPEWLALGDEAADSGAVVSSNQPIPVNQYGTNNRLALIEWSDLHRLNDAKQHCEQYINAVTHVSANSFATRVTDESMHGSDGAKLGFHRNDILIVDGSRQPHDGDYVIANHHGRILFREYVNDGSGAYLRALNAHHESISCAPDTRFLGVVINRVTVFL